MEENMLALFWTYLGAVGAGGVLGILPLSLSLAYGTVIGKREKHGRLSEEMKDALFVLYLSVCLILYFYLTMDGRGRIGVGAVLFACAFLTRRISRALDKVLYAHVLLPVRRWVAHMLRYLLSPFVHAGRYLAGLLLSILRKISLRIGRRYAILNIKKYQKQRIRRIEAFVQAFLRRKRTLNEREYPVHR